MGGAALGGNAETTLLARQIIGGLPDGGLSWLGHEANLAAGQEVEHSHEFTFIYALTGTHILSNSSESLQLLPGEGVSVDSDIIHRHGAQESESIYVEVRLTASEGTSPELPQGSRVIFESETLQGIPVMPLAAFVLVRMPQGSRTSVHTHPGPEFIYQLTGEIDYENSIIGVIKMGPGDFEGIPPGIAVQKRNPFEEEAVFLSWFLVDPALPFASAARFGPSNSEEDNLALITNGARVVSVSSNFGSGGNDSAYGANNALDGDPTTEWSSDGDGDNAVIEIELPAMAAITSIGVWTRTMGSSAQISTFRAVNELGEIAGPFTLANANEIHYFDTNFDASKLRFEVVNSSGGNTGFVDIQVFGDLLP